MAETPVVNGGGEARRESALVVHHREVPREWETRLREISPISEVISWLALNWFAPAERWVIYENVPNQFIETGFRAELEGAHPDTLPEWGRICSPFQWEMYRKHKVHARPSWVIQGANGGNKVAFNAADQELCRAVGLPPEPPQPGSLPYAPFDERVVRQLVKMNKLVKAKNDLAEFKRRHGTADADKRTFNNNLREAREQYVRFINDQFTDGTDLFVKAEKQGELSNVAKTDTDWQKLDEASDEKYLQTGRF